MSLIETLRKQAAAILEQASKLEHEQVKKELFELKQKRSEQMNRPERIGDAMRRNAIKERDRILVQAGWRQGMRNDQTGEYSYGRDGVQLKIAGGAFSVVHGPAVIKEKTNLEGLVAFIGEYKKKP